MDIKSARSGSKKPLGLTPIQQDTTPTLIARQLREAIASRQFAPGEQLLEAPLAKILGVSRGPLREAMQRLTQEGLIVSQRNRGLFVMELDESTVRDAYLARGAVERAAIEQIIVTGRQAEAAKLMEFVDAMEQHRGDPSSEELSQLDLLFHERLVELSDSPHLQRMHRTLLMEVRICLTNMQATYTTIDDRVAEHGNLAKAILAGDVEHATALLRDHMNDGMKRLLADG
ncbi:MAG: GntR family transcriptional regulator [Nocardioidaceae bacterium]